VVGLGDHVPAFLLRDPYEGRARRTARRSVEGESESEAA
jgi:hypothetical protein